MLNAVEPQNRAINYLVVVLEDSKSNATITWYKKESINKNIFKKVSSLVFFAQDIFDILLKNIIIENSENKIDVIIDEQLKHKIFVDRFNGRAQLRFYSEKEINDCGVGDRFYSYRLPDMPDSSKEQLITCTIIISHPTFENSNQPSFNKDGNVCVYSHKQTGNAEVDGQAIMRLEDKYRAKYIFSYLHHSNSYKFDQMKKKQDTNIYREDFGGSTGEMKKTLRDTIINLYKVKNSPEGVKEFFEDTIEKAIKEHETRKHLAILFYFYYYLTGEIGSQTYSNEKANEVLKTLIELFPELPHEIKLIRNYSEKEIDSLNNQLDCEIDDLSQMAKNLTDLKNYLEKRNNLNIFDLGAFQDIRKNFKRKFDDVLKNNPQLKSFFEYVIYDNLKKLFFYSEDNTHYNWFTYSTLRSKVESKHHKNRVFPVFYQVGEKFQIFELFIPTNNSKVKNGILIWEDDEDENGEERENPELRINLVDRKICEIELVLKYFESLKHFIYADHEDDKDDSTSDKKKSFIHRTSDYYNHSFNTQVRMAAYFRTLINDYHYFIIDNKGEELLTSLDINEKDNKNFTNLEENLKGNFKEAVSGIMKKIKDKTFKVEPLFLIDIVLNKKWKETGVNLFHELYEVSKNDRSLSIIRFAPVIFISKHFSEFTVMSSISMVPGDWFLGNGFFVNINIKKGENKDVNIEIEKTKGNSKDSYEKIGELFAILNLFKNMKHLTYIQYFFLSLMAFLLLTENRPQKELTILRNVYDGIDQYFDQYTPEFLRYFRDEILQPIYNDFKLLDSYGEGDYPWSIISRIATNLYTVLEEKLRRYEDGKCSPLDLKLGGNNCLVLPFSGIELDDIPLIKGIDSADLLFFKGNDSIAETSKISFWLKKFLEETECKKNPPVFLAVLFQKILERLRQKAMNKITKF